MKAILIVMYIAGGPLTGEYHDFEMQEFGTMDKCQEVAKKIKSSNKFDAYCVFYQ